jgi:hypothetical protein
MVQRCWRYTYEQGELRVRVGEERRGKETNRYPLTRGNYQVIKIYGGLIHGQILRTPMG